MSFIGIFVSVISAFYYLKIINILLSVIPDNTLSEAVSNLPYGTVESNANNKMWRTPI